MPDRRSVALLIETSNAYGRGLLDGIIAYQREHELWSVYLGEHERGARPPDWMKNWRGDGIIARIETDAIAAVVKRSRLPAVDGEDRERPAFGIDPDGRARVFLRHHAAGGDEVLAIAQNPRVAGDHLPRIGRDLFGFRDVRPPVRIDPQHRPIFAGPRPQPPVGHRPPDGRRGLIDLVSRRRPLPGFVH